MTCDDVMVWCSWMIKEIDTAGMLEVVCILIRNVCTKVPDRAEYRTKISQVGTLC